MRPLLLLLCCFSFVAAAQAGIVRGHITDPQGAALPFANIAVRGSATSTASNEQGNYQLRLEPGRYELVFQYVGYRPRIEAVRVAAGDSATVLDVTLTAENYKLGEVVVRGSDKDPAYAIVQQAINWRPYHQREVAAFRARSYIKALGRLIDVPGRVLGIMKIGPDVKPGIFYLSESVSEMTFRQPDVIRERMISSRISGDAKGISFNSANSGKGLNFYNNLLKSGFSERGFVSPIAGNAMLFYKYELEGSTQQGGLTIHKIRVTARRRNDPVFSAGHIYIVDGTWRLHSVSLDLTADAQLKYVDRIHIEQQFAPAPGPSDVWVMQSQKVTLGFEKFGFKGNGYITAILSNYQVTPTYPNRPAPTAPKPAQPASTAPVYRETVAEVKKQKPSFSGLARQVRQRVKRATVDSLTGQPIERVPRGQVLLVDKSANERDSSYWAEVRPIPLTDEEKKDYQVKDSTEVIRKSRPYQDSLDHVRNQPDPKSMLLLGYTHSSTFAKRRLYVAPVFNIVQYNTVEGAVVNAYATYTQDTDDRRYYTLTPTLRYGFANKVLSPNLAATWQHDAVRLARLSLNVGQTVENFDRNSQLTPFINSVYTLLDNRNLAKYYRRTGAEVSYLREVLNGLTLRGTLGYDDRRELQNATIDLLRDVKGRAFTPNQPLSAETPDTGFGRNQALTFELFASFRPGQRYITRPDGKFNLSSNAPTFRASFRQGIPDLLGSDVRYSLVAVGVNQTINMGLFGTGTYNVAAGRFLGSPTLSFMDYRHFSGNRTLLTGNFAQFQLLDYYRFSTRSRYVEAHYNQHFNGFFVNKVPLLRRLKWQEVVSFNYLHTPQAGHYVELGAGIEHIFGILRADVYTALQSGQKLGSGVRLGLGL